MVMVSIGGVTGSEKTLVAATDELSVTRMVNVGVPTIVGVPDMTPAVRLSPGGNDPLASDQV